MKARRYQLTKDAASIILRGHPWLFRDSLSSAASVFQDGDLLRLVDGTNTVVAWGIYEAEGAIAVRIVRRGAERPDAKWLTAALTAAIGRRAALGARTTGIRLVHGESDGIPAVVADRFGDTIVVTSYSQGADAYARFVARSLRTQAANVVIAPAHRRRGVPQPVRVISGAPPEVATFVEDGLAYAVDLAEGQKTGTYLDLRGLRSAIAGLPLAGARTLNLFSYTGMLGRAAEAAGATDITHVDQSARALTFARTHHATDPSRHHYIEADIFAWLPTFEAQPFDLVIVDPPSMTSSKAQVPKVLAAYKKLYKTARTHVAPGGRLVAACCTSRIERAVFARTVKDALGEGFTQEHELPVELDHPVGFPQADYLKISLWRRSS
ncbi:MAG TPA: class I SAM-dependent methyltransferase [Kofleriaceae bacterium]|nr:class I SAM-dependent methyltransferase [Kofleriaceae bacterium]